MAVKALALAPVQSAEFVPSVPRIEEENQDQKLNARAEVAILESLSARTFGDDGDALGLLTTPGSRANSVFQIVASVRSAC